MERKRIELQGRSFEIIPMTGREAARVGFGLIKFIGPALSTIALIFNDSGQEKKDLSSFSSSIRDVFMSMDEKTFDNYLEIFLSKVLYDNMEFLKVWDSKLNSDLELGIALLVESVKVNYGFFYKVFQEYKS